MTTNFEIQKTLCSEIIVVTVTNHYVSYLMIVTFDLLIPTWLIHDRCHGEPSCQLMKDVV